MDVSSVHSVVPIPAMCHELFMSVNHTLIFATLALAYICETMEDHHHFQQNLRLMEFPNIFSFPVVNLNRWLPFNLSKKKKKVFQW